RAAPEPGCLRGQVVALPLGRPPSHQQSRQRLRLRLVSGAVGWRDGLASHPERRLCILWGEIGILAEGDSCAGLWGLKILGRNALMMSWDRQVGYSARWRWEVMASLFVFCMCWPAHGYAATKSQTQHTWQVASEAGARVTVVQGRLSVDLRDADIQTVLAQIAKQAGITLLTGPLERQTVSVQFTDVPLEQGVRRLLRLVSLNHVMLSAPDPAGRVALKELRVFATGDTRSPFVVAVRPTEVVAVQVQ